MPPPQPAPTPSSCRRSSPRSSSRPSCPAPAHVAGRVARRVLPPVRARRSRAARVVARARGARSGRAVDAVLASTPSTCSSGSASTRYKIASGDLTWDPLIARVAATGKPLVISTGMADARRSATCARRRASRWRDRRRAAALRLRVSGAAGQREPARHSRRSPSACRRAGRPLRSRRRHVRAADGRRARRLALRTASGARRRRRRDRSRRLEHAGRARGGDSAPRDAPGRRSGPAARCVCRRGRQRDAPAADRCAPRAPCRPARAAAVTISSRSGRRPGWPPGALGAALVGPAPVRSRRTPASRSRWRSSSQYRDRSGGRIVSLNVLITAGSRRVPLVQAFQRALRAHRRRLGHRHRRQSAVADGLRRRSLVRGAAVDRSGLSRRRSSRSAAPSTSAWSCRRSTTSCSLFAEQVARFADLGVRVAVSPPETIDGLQRQVRDLPRAGRARHRRGGDVPAVGPAGRSGVSAVHQAARRPRRRRRLPVRSQRELDFFLELRARSRRPDLPGRPGVHDRRAVRLHGRAALDRAARARRHPRRRRRSRPHRARSAAHRARPRLRARAARSSAPVNIQCRVVDGRPVVFEINPRFSGGIPLTIAAGADFPRMLVDAGARTSRVAVDGRFQDRPVDDELRDVGVRAGRRDVGVLRADVAPRSRRSRDGATAIVLQARIGSRRLPGKVLAPIGRRTILEHCIVRLDVERTAASSSRRRRGPRTTRSRTKRDGIGASEVSRRRGRRARPVSRGGARRST